MTASPPGRDFADTGELKHKSVVHLDEAMARGIATAVQEAPVVVTSVQEKPYTRRPAAPFTTSTLQQEASRKLRLSSKNAMRVAQRLYENGYITYMRTDSITLSESAITAARSQARDLYGADYVPAEPRRYAGKVKNAQEAHEAIRPAGDRFRTPAQVAGELRGDEFALYELIWKRTVASQMADARGSTATVKLTATLDGVEVARAAEFTASGTVITFRGFLAAYEEGRDETVAKKRKEIAEEERRLPKLGEGTPLAVIRAEADGHETQPPPRYTEATLVKAMEEKGIGRPSTYASIMGTIQDRGYVGTRGNALVPTWLAFAVTRLLEEHFPRLVDYDFTASMEEDLDRIANGDEQRVAWLERFYFGDEAGSAEGLKQLVDDLGEIDAREISTIQLGDGMVVRVGRYGPYVEEVTPAGVDARTGRGAPRRGAGGARDAAPRHDQRRHRPRRDDARQGARAARRGRRRRTSARPGPLVRQRDHRQGRSLRAYVTEVLPETEPTSGAQARQGRGEGQAAYRVAVQGHGPRDDRPRRRAAAALAAACGRDGRRGGRHVGRHHRTERTLRALPQEGDRLAVAGDRAAALRRSPSTRRSRSTPSRSSAAAPPRLHSRSSAPTRCRARR